MKIRHVCVLIMRGSESETRVYVCVVTRRDREGEARVCVTGFVIQRYNDN